MNRYLAEEFTDRKRMISSLELYHIGQRTTEIFYNQITTDDLNREFVSYDLDGNSCVAMKIYKWPLSTIRETVIWIVPNEKLTRDICDIALGPTGMLLAIESTATLYNFVAKTYDKHILSNIDIYRRTVVIPSMDVSLVVSVGVRSHGPLKSSENRTLTDAYATDKKVDYVYVEICHIGDKSSIESGKITECKDTELKVRVDYLSVSNMLLGSLVGNTLEQSSDYEFQRDPFMRPVGIGCWQQSTSGVGFQRFVPPSTTFSGQYVTEIETRDYGYVAFDGEKQLLRLDRHERKNIYDLDGKTSYHMNLFEEPKRRASYSKQGKNCIALQSLVRFIQESNPIEKLLGFSSESSSAAYHLGSKMINHVLHKVYESKMAFDNSMGEVNFPILLEAPVILDKSNEYYVTYYMTELKGGDSQVAPVIRYIEMWELVRGSNKKRLINRLEFAEFDWSLDVEPQDDLEGSIFGMSSCSMERAGQLDMHFLVTSSDPSKSANRKALARRRQVKIVESLVHKTLRSKLDISPLNMAQLSANFDPNSGDIIVDTKIVELKSGVSNDELIFYGRFGHLQVAFSESILMMTVNRHSLDECRLDSLTLTDQPNVFIYCPRKTLCMLIAAEAAARYQKGSELSDRNHSTSTVAPDNDDTPICSAHRFGWGPSPTSPVDSVMNKVLGSQFRLSYSHIEVPLESNNKLDMYITLPHMKKVDSIHLLNGGLDLVDLRFLTHSEDQQLARGNKLVKLERKSELLRHCHMACQFDQFCESYSICVRGKRESIKPTDCILSPIRLSQQVVEAIESKARVKNGSDTIVMEMPPETDLHYAEHFKLQREHGCSLHPKDALMTFKFSGEIKGQKPDDHETSSKLGELASLEGCAELAYDRSLWLNPYESEFIYCPIEQLCIVEAELVKQLTQRQTCFKYTRSLKLFYAERAYSRLSIRMDKLDDGASYKTINTKDKLEELNIGHWIEGIGEEQCARDCGLHHSNCLNFDTCRFQKKSSLTQSFIDLCIIYSIRDPAQAISNKLGLLPQEERFYSLDEQAKPSPSSLHFSGNINCSHFSLHDFYLDLRLRYMLNELKPTGQQDMSDQVSAELDKIDQSILDQDLKRSKAELEEMRNRLDQDSSNKKDNSSSGSINGLLFAIGLVMGVLVTIYGGSMVTLVESQYQWLQGKLNERRHQNRRLSQLVLNTNIEF